MIPPAISLHGKVTITRALRRECIRKENPCPFYAGHKPRGPLYDGQPAEDYSEAAPTVYCQLPMNTRGILMQQLYQCWATAQPLKEAV